MAARLYKSEREMASIAEEYRNTPRRLRSRVLKRHRISGDTARKWGKRFPSVARTEPVVKEGDLDTFFDLVKVVAIAVAAGQLEKKRALKLIVRGMAVL